MLVSLIIPVYNVEEYLPGLIDSVKAQTHQELEIIMIDDGSSDSSGRICDSFAESDSRVKVIHTANSSASDARNKGIASATGKYLAFADSDDYLAEDYIEYLLRLCTDNGADISCCAWTTDAQGNLSKCTFRGNEPGLYKGNREAMRALMTTRLMSSSVWAKLFKRSLFDGVKFPEGQNYYEDDAILYRLAAKAEAVAIGGESKYFYRLRDGSLIHRSFEEYNLDIIKVFEERCAFIEDNYPELASLAKADILMVVNHCVLKLAESKLYHHPCISDLKGYYRKYEKYFLKGISYFPAKFFSVVAYVSIPLAMRLYRLTGKHL